MIEIVLSKKEYIKFTAEARKRMRIKGWNIEHLAEHIGRPINSVYDFFSRKKRTSRFLAAEIAEALDMESKDWR